MKITSLSGAALALGMMAIAGSASATITPVCSSSNFASSTASAYVSCAGFVAGNVLSNSGPDVTAQKAELALIGLTEPSGWTFASVPSADKIASLGGSTTVNFGRTMYGITYVGLHFGKGTATNSPAYPVNGGATAFYEFNFGSTGASSILLNPAYTTSSGAALYSTGAAPEPAAWALMMVGVGGMGAALRTRRRKTVAA